MAIKRRGRGRKKPEVEINITAFMNLMVVLVPFLLMTAVFTHLTILELNLPSADSAKNNKSDKPTFELQVTIRKDALVLAVSGSDKMVALVGQMLDLHKRLNEVKTPDEKVRIKRQVEGADKQIDELVYGLYGLTEEEIKVVEGELR